MSEVLLSPCLHEWRKRKRLSTLSVEGPLTRGTSLGGVPREQKMLQENLPTVMFHQVYQYTKIIHALCSLLQGHTRGHSCWFLRRSLKLSPR